MILMPHAITVFVREHKTSVQIVVYLTAFFACMVCIQKLDDIGSAWRGINHANMNCTVTPDGIVHSPVCNIVDVQAVRGADWQPIESSASNPGFCVPHAPWFWYDLGGTMCVCEKKWEQVVYFQKVMTSFAFNFPHFMTPFQIYIVYQRWQWVFMYITFNEVFEEVCLAVTGKWGFTFDIPYDLEPRYDSLIRDVLLCGIPGLLFGIAFVRVMKVPRFILAPLDGDWEATDRHSKKYHLKILFQMLALKQIALVYNTDEGVSTFYPQNILLIIMNVALIFGFYMQNHNDWPPHCHTNIVRFHSMWAVLSAGIWSFTVYPLLDELYLLCAAIACCSLMLMAIFICTRHSNTAAKLVIGVQVHVACMSTSQYDDWVDGDVMLYKSYSEADMNTKMLKIASLMDLLALHREQGDTHISMLDITAAVSESKCDVKQGEQTTLLLDSPGSLTGEYRDVGLPEQPISSSYFTPPRQLFCLMTLIASMLLLCFATSEPYTYVGLMYKRHWCGLVMANGGNGCILMK